MGYEQISVERRDAVSVITLQRPERLNAWTPRMSAELTDAVTAADDDDAVGAVVVTGAGRAFCAGADIGGHFAKSLDGGADDHGDDLPPERDWVRLCRESKPLLAAVNGPAIGVGLTMVLPFDQLVAARGAKLSARFVKMGLVPELASSHFLVARCGWGAASWLALSGATIPAEQALELRLVDHVTEPEEVLPRTLELAAELAANPPWQVRATKALLTANAVETDLAAVQRRELEALQQSYETPEHREAVAAFLEKRQPVFRP